MDLCILKNLLTREDPTSICWSQWMRRALQLASLADGCTSPNPLVGAVVLDKEGKLVGEGFHPYAGGHHAEVEALSQAAEKATGGTLVVTLEPCCHFGRTPPCTAAILEAGISRAVVGLQDPDPRVSGKGIALLKDSGLEVISGVLQQESAYLNRAFIFRVKTGRPWGILKWAMSMDGRIALTNGESKWITSQEARSVVHSLRAKCDSVIVGAGTVRADNPLLTSRGVSNPEPLRVVLTNSLDFPKESNIFNTSMARTIVASGSDLKEEFSNQFQGGPEFLKLKSSQPLDLLEALAKKGCNRVLWECGPTLATSAIKQNCVQELLVVVAPKLLGGMSSMNPLNDFGFKNLSEVIEMKNLVLTKRENNLLINMLYP